MYFVYKHTRLDKNEVFYIGIGTIPSQEILDKYNGNTDRGKYKRAFDKVKSRSNHWKNIIALTDYQVDIIFLTDNIEKVKAKEIELIELYKDTVCNQTKGGDGIEGYTHSEEVKKKIGDAFRGKTLTEEHKLKVNLAKFKKIAFYTKDGIYQGEFDSLQEAACYIDTIKCMKNISAAALGKRPTAYGYVWKYVKENTDIKNKESL